MKKCSLRILSILLAFVFTAVVFLPCTHAFARSRAGLMEPEAKERFEDGEHSLQLPYYDDGTPFIEKRAAHTENDDFSFVRVLLTYESSVNVTNIVLRLHGAYYIDQNLTPLVGTEAQPASVTLTAQGGTVTVQSGETVLYQGAAVDINRVLLSEAGGYAGVTTTPSSYCSGKNYLGSFRVTASGGYLRLINVIPTVHYVYGVTPHEITYTSNIETFKALSVATRSYAFAYPAQADDHDITASMSHLGYRGYVPGHSRAMQASIATIGELLFYNGKIPLAFFGATNGGETNLPSYEFGASPVNGVYDVRSDAYDIQYGTLYRMELPIEYGEPVTNEAFRALIDDEVTSALGHAAELQTVLRAEVNTPKFPDTALNLTMMDLVVRVLDGGSERSVSLRFDVRKLGDYGVLVPPNNRNFRIFWGHIVPNGYVVYRCRYGHGIGLSQLAADGRAREGHTHRQILDFYYPNAELLGVYEKNPELPYSYSKQAAAYGTVNVNSRLRSGPSTNHDILESLPAGTHVEVITEVDNWLVCIANDKLGYIRGDLVNVSLFPAPVGGEHPLGTAVVKTGVEDAALRFGPSEYSSVLFTLFPGMQVQVWHRIGSWYHVRFAGRYAFIHESKITTPNFVRVDERYNRFKLG